MAQSSLLGIDTLNSPAPALDDALALGPSDSSDTGSDRAGLGGLGGSDSAGTGERRGAIGDTGGPEAADLAVDRLFSRSSRLFVDDDEARLADDVEAGTELTPLDAPGADEDAAADDVDDEVAEEAGDPVGDSHSDADLATRLPQRPSQPNPAPDSPEDPAPLSPDDDLPLPDGDERRHVPGREPASLADPRRGLGGDAWVRGPRPCC